MNCIEETPSRKLLGSWLNKTMRIKMTDGRILIGVFMCTDRDRNVIIGSCQEFLKEDTAEEPRVLGLAMVPGHHIVTIDIDQSQMTEECTSECDTCPLSATGQ